MQINIKLSYKLILSILLWSVISKVPKITILQNFAISQEWSGVLSKLYYENNRFFKRLILFEK